MEFIEQQPSSKAPADWFTGDVWWDVIVAGQAPSRMRANLVRFSPGARTNWHSHALGQTLHVVSGIALIGTRDGTSSRPTPVRRSRARRTRSTGTAPPPTGSWSTSPCGRARTTGPPRPPGPSRSPTSETAAHPQRVAPAARKRLQDVGYPLLTERKGEESLPATSGAGGARLPR